MEDIMNLPGTDIVSGAEGAVIYLKQDDVHFILSLRWTERRESHRPFIDYVLVLITGPDVSE